MFACIQTPGSLDGQSGHCLKEKVDGDGDWLSVKFERISSVIFREVAVQDRERLNICQGCR